MLRIEKTLDGSRTLAAALLRRAATLTLPFEERCRSRLAATLDDGRPVALFLPRGTVLRDGAVLVAEDGSLVRVVAAPQPVLRASSSDGLALLRAAYHLGNRHTPVQVTREWLQLEPDPVLRDMLLRLGVQVQALQAPFEPEAGAYGGGHRHGHDETFQEDYAAAQAVYAHRHGGEGPHGHEHAHDRSHGHGHAHPHHHDDGHRHDGGHHHGEGHRGGHGPASSCCG